MTCYCNHLIVYDTKTGSSFTPKCKSYICPEHGAFNRGRLRRALYNHIKRWDHIRLWTFTLSSNSSETPVSHLQDLNQIWRYFTTYLRRFKYLSKSERGLQYIRFAEQHSSGYWHFHCLFDRYIDYHKVRMIWERAVTAVTDSAGDRSGVNVKHMMNAKNAAFYVVKYVSKATGVMYKGSKTWTRSSRFGIFPKRDQSKSYAIYNCLTREWYGLRDPIPLLVLSLEQFHTELIDCELFPTGTPPPA